MTKRRKLTLDERNAKGGASGTGKAKARTSAVARAAAMVRWDRVRAEKSAAGGAQ